MNPTPAPGSPCQLPIDDLDLTLVKKLRARLNNGAVREYVQKLKEGRQAPAIKVWSIGKRWLVADGWHRVEAAKQHGASTILADVASGTEEDALRYALKANDEHGVRRTNSDKKLVGLAALERFPNESAGEIAMITGLSQPYISKLRKAREGAASSTPRKGRDGRMQPGARRATSENPARGCAPALATATGKPPEPEADEDTGMTGTAGAQGLAGGESAAGTGIAGREAPPQLVQIGLFGSTQAGLMLLEREGEDVSAVIRLVAKRLRELGRGTR